MDRAGTRRDALARLGAPLAVLFLAAAGTDLLAGSRDLLSAVSLLILGVQSIKLLLPKRASDGWQLCAIALLEFLAAAASTDALLFALVAFLFLAASAGAMWGLHLQDDEETGRPPGGYEVPARAAAAALLLAGFGGILISGALFAAVPRLELRRVLQRFSRAQAVTGFSERITLREVTGVKADRSVVARVEFPFLPQGEYPTSLYLRGAVYSRFDGDSWRSAGTPTRFLPRAGFHYITGSAARGAPLSVAEITLEPSDHPALFSYGQPVVLEGALGAVLADGEGNLSLSQAGHSTLRYSVQFAPGVLSPRQPDPPGKGYLAIPDGFEDVRTLGREVAGEEGTDADRAARLLRLFRSGFRYTVADPAASLREFLFSKRAGFCEHYASALALLLRSSGIPSRVAVGYLGGEWNELGQYLIVRQSDAHAWTEGWIGGRWVQLDATPPLGEDSPFLVRTGTAGLYIDWVRQRWDKYVVNYSLRMQADAVAGGWSAFRRTGRAVWSPGGLGAVRNPLRIAAIACIAAVALFLLYRMRVAGRRKIPPGSADRLATPYRRLARRLERAGCRTAPGTPMEGMLSAAARSRPLLSADALRFLALYHRDRFGPRPLAPEERREAFRLAVLLRRAVGPPVAG
jgi:transglutaminase-like putative cysteine protease